MSSARPHLSDAGRFYVGFVAIVGTSIVLHSLLSLATESIGYYWFVLAGLTLLSGSFTIRIPGIPARLSVSETFVFAAAMLFGPAAATVIVVLDSLIISLWLRGTSKKLSRVLFNMSAPAISIWAASHTFFAVAGVAPLADKPQPILSLAPPLLLLALLYFLLNSWLIAIAVGFANRTSPFFVWRNNFLWLSLNYFSGASVAALLLPYLQEMRVDALLSVASILLPLLLISYLTFKTALGRVEDANRHLTELNRLYLSTIETLAMAIDAKDQITHGHIRRVQAFAVRLATEMGVDDSSLIRAIEAAALLHDMGKLAVPEYILNKPGPLTPAEFEKMKLHASAGADILSAIDFPYPVVPIVRHHHENWDGTGYPDGISGADIPIGARILSVVDCFDALTSDRPYRPRLSEQNALKILVNRRGTMYDPLVVDTFLHLYSRDASEHTTRTVTPEISRSHPDAAATNLLPPAANPLDDIAGSTEETLTLFSLGHALTSLTDMREVADVISKHLRRLIPCSLYVLYLYDNDKDELFVAAASGENAALLLGMRMNMGERLSGWVAANRIPIRNSDPVLDFGESARAMHPRLHGCLSAPLLIDEQLIGVQSVYSTSRASFSDEQQRVLEIVARQVAPAIRQCYEYHRARVSPLHDPITGLPHFESFAADAGLAEISSGPVSLLLLGVERLEQIAEIHGRAAAEAVLEAVVRVTRRGLRTGDSLFRHAESHFVALLLQTDHRMAIEIAGRIKEAIALERSAFEHGTHMQVTVSVSSAPRDGRVLKDILGVALERQTRPSSVDGSRTESKPSASIH